MMHGYIFKARMKPSIVKRSETIEYARLPVFLQGKPTHRQSASFLCQDTLHCGASLPVALSAIATMSDHYARRDNRRLGSAHPVF